MTTRSAPTGRLTRWVAVTVAALAAVGTATLLADVAPTPTWRLASGVTAAAVRGDTMVVGGTFTQLFTPSSSQNQFYDFVTGQVRTDCARSTDPDRALSGVPDNRGGLLVSVHEDDTFADVNGDFVPPDGTTIVRIAETCLWDRQFAAPAIDPLAPSNLTIGTPARVGNVVVATNAVIGPDFITLRAQAAAFDATSGARLRYEFYQGRSEVGVLGATATRIIVRVRASSLGGYTLGALNPSTLALTETTTVLADETLGVRSWIRGDVMYRLRPPPANTLEAFDLTTLAAKAGWTAPVVLALTDLDVVGTRVFLTSRVVNNQTVVPPSAVLAASGALDTTWSPPALTRRVPDPSGVPYAPTLTTLATDGQRLYFAGDFERVGGADREGVAALSVVSAALDAWDPAPELVSPLEATTTALLATRPTGTNRVTRRFLAAINRTTGLATAWNPNDPARVLLHQPTPVAAIALDATFAYVASATSGEVWRADLVTGDVDQTWRVALARSDGTPGVVTQMVTVGGVVYLGGEFARVSGSAITTTTRRALAAVSADGRLVPWAPSLDGPAGATLVRTLLALGNTIYVGGDFTSVDTQFRTGLAAVDATSGQLVQPEMVVLGETSIYGLATDGAQTFVAGVSFGAPLVGAVSIPDSVLTQFGPTNNVVPTSAAFVAGHLYAGLEYDTEAGQPTTRTTRWGKVVADDRALVHILEDGAVEYYAALPGNPPAPPTLAAVATDNTVLVSWTPALTGGAASSYTLRAGSAPGLTNLASIPVRGSTTYTASAPTGTYFLTVVARNGFGASAPSNEVAVQVGCVTAPPAPTALAFQKAGATVALGWSAAVSASSYRIEAGATSGSSSLGAIALGNVTSYLTSAPLGTYYVRVRAANRCGVSTPSNEIVIPLDGTTSLPAAPTGLAARVEGRTVTIGWTPATAGGLASRYQVDAGTSPGGVVGSFVTTTPRLVVPNAPPGTYYVRVRALNAAGASGPTSDVVVTIR